jgi:zinc/manganese transport system substrate-binding protein
MFALRKNLLLGALSLAVLGSADAATDEEAAADFVHEWAAVFPIADASHKYLMQEVEGSYADPNMKVVLIPTTELNIEGIHTTEGAVAALMEGDSCETVANGETASAVAETGSCYDLVVDETIKTNTFNLVTDGLTGVAVYTQHVPYEFEDDLHFFKDSADADIEPVAEETVGGHGHGHGHGHSSHADEEEGSGAASVGGFVGSAIAGVIVAAAL